MSTSCGTRDGIEFASGVCRYRIFAGPAARLTGGEVNTKMNTHTNIRGVVCSTVITSIFWPFAE